MLVVQRIQLLFKLLRHVLFDSAARPFLRYLRALISRNIQKLNAVVSIIASAFWRVKGTKKSSQPSLSTSVINDCAPVTICASRLHPNPFLTLNAAQSSQDLGLLPIDGYSLENLENLPGPSHSQQPSSGESLRIIIDSPSTSTSETLSIFDHLQTSSPEEIDFDSTAGDVPIITKAALSEAYDSFFAIAPEGVPRYDRNIIVPEKETQYCIESLTTQFNREDVPPGWTPMTHPEGILYFYNQSKRIYTDANLFDNDIFTDLDDHVMKLEDFLRAQNLQLDPDVDIVLDLYKGDDQRWWCYYFASHAHRAIFWLEQFEASSLIACTDVKGVTSSTHLKHEIESQYWYHCQLYPNACEITRGKVDELRDILMHALCDTLTSHTSTAPYSSSELEQMLSLTNSLRKSADRNMMGTSAAFCRMMQIFVRQRFYNFYSQVSARLDRDQSIYGHATTKRTPIMSVLSPILFYAPDVHQKELHKLWMDGLVHHVTWVHFINKLNTEWQDFILFSTVLLNANVAFLAIQSVDSTSNQPSRSPAQISSYISVIASIGSIITGLLLIRQNRNKWKGTAQEAATFLKAQADDGRGLETLAILYSLPYSLLLWSMVSFLIAFSFTTFNNSSTLVDSLIGAAWFSVAALVTWCIITPWEARERGFWVSLMSHFRRKGTVSCSNDVAEDRMDVKSIASRSIASSRRRTPWRRLSMFKRSSSMTVV